MKWLPWSVFPWWTGRRGQQKHGWCPKCCVPEDRSLYNRRYEKLIPCIFCTWLSKLQSEIATEDKSCVSSGDCLWSYCSYFHVRTYRRTRAASILRIALRMQGVCSSGALLSICRIAKCPVGLHSELFILLALVGYPTKPYIDWMSFYVRIFFLHFRYLSVCLSMHFLLWSPWAPNILPIKYWIYSTALSNTI
jgi:hypothetical protein